MQATTEEKSKVCAPQGTKMIRYGRGISCVILNNNKTITMLKTKCLIITI